MKHKIYLFSVRKMRSDYQIDSLGLKTYENDSDCKKIFLLKNIKLNIIRTIFIYLFVKENHRIYGMDNHCSH